MPSAAAMGCTRMSPQLLLTAMRSLGLSPTQSVCLLQCLRGTLCHGVP
uniref:Uncharacterized protein n=1 Tax=Arundo donax TaxID=35708 RepID=A0A0A8ZJ28_ARUDO